MRALHWAALAAVILNGLSVILNTILLVIQHDSEYMWWVLASSIALTVSYDVYKDTER